MAKCTVLNVKYFQSWRKKQKFQPSEEERLPTNMDALLLLDFCGSGIKKLTLYRFLDLAVAKSLQSTRTVTDDADADDVLTTC